MHCTFADLGSNTISSSSSSSSSVGCSELVHMAKCAIIKVYIMNCGIIIIIMYVDHRAMF